MKKSSNPLTEHWLEVHELMKTLCNPDTVGDLAYRTTREFLELYWVDWNVQQLQLHVKQQRAPFKWRPREQSSTVFFIADPDADPAQRLFHFAVGSCVEGQVKVYLLVFTAGLEDEGNFDEISLRNALQPMIDAGQAAPEYMVCYAALQTGLCSPLARLAVLNWYLVKLMATGFDLRQQDMPPQDEKPDMVDRFKALMQSCADRVMQDPPLGLTAEALCKPQRSRQRIYHAHSKQCLFCARPTQHNNRQSVCTACIDYINDHLLPSPRMQDVEVHTLDPSAVRYKTLELFYEAIPRGMYLQCRLCQFCESPPALGSICALCVEKLRVLHVKSSILDAATPAPVETYTEREFKRKIELETPEPKRRQLDQSAEGIGEQQSTIKRRYYRYICIIDALQRLLISDAQGKGKAVPAKTAYLDKLSAMEWSRLRHLIDRCSHAEPQLFNCTEEPITELTMRAVLRFYKHLANELSAQSNVALFVGPKFFEERAYKYTAQLQRDPGYFLLSAVLCHVHPGNTCHRLFKDIAV